MNDTQNTESGPDGYTHLKRCDDQMDRWHGLKYLNIHHLYLSFYSNATLSRNSKLSFAAKKHAIPVHSTVGNFL